MSFVFNPENAARAKTIIARYPEGKQASAVIPLLDIAQRQNGSHVTREVMDYIAEYLAMPPIKVYEVATFYTMFNKEKVGKNFIQICTTTPCWLRGSDDIKRVCHEKLGVHANEITPDGKFSYTEVECLGACVNAPMVQINDDYFEDLTPVQMAKMIDDLSADKKLSVGSQTGRQGSAPLSVKKR